MFDQVKAMGALGKLVANKDKLREAGERLQHTLEEARLVGSAGGGAVRVTVTGKMQVTDVTLDPALIAGLGVGEGGRMMAQALVAEAVNDALRSAQRYMQEEAQRSARELGLPEIPGLDRLLG